MLEVNDFNAVRISLASPEQIRGWSYGQVTKPETINYRTLKPEKDGLFCEKIFGPTKDFECYCGKYKRIRYKGIICDKCGVEVTRSKVRRERMGHIELASPVSHIWFVKGTPSRLGLLLDISPRSLERILYFAQYIVTSVDEEARGRTVESLQADAAVQAEAREETLTEQFAVTRKELDERVGAIETKRDEDMAGRDALLHEQIEGLKTKMAEIGEIAEKKLGEATVDAIKLGSKTIVKRGGKIHARHAEAAKNELENQIGLASSKAEVEKSRMERQAESAVKKQRDAALSEEDSVRKKMADEAAKQADSIETDIENLNELGPLQILTEGQYREYRDKFGPVFEAGMGAEAILQVIIDLDMDELRENLRGEIYSTSGQRRKKATKRLRVVEAFRKSGNKPDWMIIGVLPVLPPDLRPMVQLDGGRFATSDLNDLYRRVINRNNRLRRLLNLGAPEIIIRNEKRMLQEAVDSLIDNGRRGRAVSGTSNRKLKSLSDMLKGKQGRFRQNLLGKRVDYSGRSVIIVGPELKLHECGLPKRMALELFKPFVMRRLVERGFAHNIKSAKRVVERVKPEVWDVLEEVIKDRPVLLNRAPTLHRLGIQAFQPVLIEGSAIRIHPLVCTAFNADFDGDQMAVHVPLSEAAIQEALDLMLSTRNMLLPSSGEPTVAPTLDMVLGCYYLTLAQDGLAGEGRVFADFDEAVLAHDLGQVHLHAKVKVREVAGGEMLETTVGRIIINQILPSQLPFMNEVLDKKTLKDLVARCYQMLGHDETSEVLDHIKRLGFEYATRSGTSIAVDDVAVPEAKVSILNKADKHIDDAEAQYRRGLITEEERYAGAIDTWTRASKEIDEAIDKSLDRFGPIYMMANSGAKGNMSQIRQMAGMRGLMSDPSGRIIELPIRSSFREGLSVLEYFISTHGARKGLADTALRTADSGYLTRRLIDVAQDVIVLEPDCETTDGIWIRESPELAAMEPLAKRILGRVLARDLIVPGSRSGKILIEANATLDDDEVAKIQKAEIDQIFVRSPLTCELRHGVCQACYGRSLAMGRLVSIGEAVGIIAAQSIGEPGTQLTMRTFHTGGVAGGVDITSGLPRIEELFEARVPKGQAIVSDIEGLIEVIRGDGGRRILVSSTEIYRDEYPVPPNHKVIVKKNDMVEAGATLAEAISVRNAESKPATLVEARIGGRIALEGRGKNRMIVVFYEDRDDREYAIPAALRITVEDGDRVHAGDRLTVGSRNPQDILRINGRERVEEYVVAEVQRVYRSQGVNINDKHIEIIVRQMLRKVGVESPGDTELLPGELVDRFKYEDINAKVLAEGGEPAAAQPVLLGITKASLNTESFLAAASFQETTRVLTEAAVTGQTDRLLGLKENVIIGKLIPAGSGIPARRQRPAAALTAEIIDEVGEIPDAGEKASAEVIGVGRLALLLREDDDDDDDDDKNENADSGSDKGADSKVKSNGADPKPTD